MTVPCLVLCCVIYIYRESQLDADDKEPNYSELKGTMWL